MKAPGPDFFPMDRAAATKHTPSHLIGPPEIKGGGEGSADRASLARRLFASGLTGPAIAARLGVHPRTVRKLLAKSAAPLPEDATLALPRSAGDAASILEAIVLREIAALQAASERQPGRHATTIIRLASALSSVRPLAIKLADQDSDDDAPPRDLEAFRAELTRRLDALRQRHQPFTDSEAESEQED